MRKGAGDIGLHLEPEQVESFSLFAQELSRWNRKMNLTRVPEGADVVVKHFLASLAFTAAFPREFLLRLVDIGSGAGFPGIPIKIACPHFCLTLIEASRKKISFLRHMCTLLNLQKIEAMRVRAEELASDPEYGGRFDVAVVRAVGSPENLIETAGGLLRPGGRFILSARTIDERQFPEGGGLVFKESLRVRFPSVDLERRLLIWEKSD